MGRWMGVVFWAVANVLIGLCAILPLGLLAALAGADDKAPFDVEGQAGRAALLVAVTLGILGALFAVVNIPSRRHLPPPVPSVVWPAAVLLALIPAAVFLLR